MSIKLSWAMAIAMGSSSWLYRIANNIRTRTECKLYSIINNMGLLLRLQIQSACRMQLHASPSVGSALYTIGSHLKQLSCAGGKRRGRSEVGFLNTNIELFSS